MASTTHLISNKKLVNNIRSSGKSEGVISNGGEIRLEKTATMNGIRDVPYSEEGIINLLSMAKLVDDGFWIYINTNVEDTIYVHTPNG